MKRHKYQPAPLSLDMITMYTLKYNTTVILGTLCMETQSLNAWIQENGVPMRPSVNVSVSVSLSVIVM